jgi:hypothetical protein
LYNSINYIFIDPKNNIWLSSNLGLNRIELDDNNNLTRLKSYTISDGLYSNDVRDCFVDENKAYVATSNGLNIIDISNEVQGQIVDEDGNVRLDSGWQQRQKLRIDSLKWLLSKMNPGQYGDRIQQEVNADVKTSSKSIDWSKVPDDALEAIIKSQKKNDK